jgi:hypothetical protein
MCAKSKSRNAQKIVWYNQKPDYWRDLMKTLKIDAVATRIDAEAIQMSAKLRFQDL